VRLFLGSSRPLRPVPELTRLFGPRGRAGVIGERADFEFVAALGFEAVEPSSLAEVDLFWVGGGNPFVIRAALRRRGFDGELCQRLAHDTLAYGGYSAGACVAGSSLEGLELVDPPPRRLKPIWEGLGLVDFRLVPHRGAPGALGEEIERVIDLWQAGGVPHRALADGQAIVVDGERSEDLVLA
jgi:dipeptidase E